jgi:hypothetical protein
VSGPGGALPAAADSDVRSSSAFDPLMRNLARVDDLDALRERADMVAGQPPFSVRTALKEVVGTYVDELEKAPAGWRIARGTFQRRCAAAAQRADSSAADKGMKREWRVLTALHL